MIGMIGMIGMIWMIWMGSEGKRNRLAGWMVNSEHTRDSDADERTVTDTATPLLVWAISPTYFGFDGSPVGLLPRQSALSSTPSVSPLPTNPGQPSGHRSAP